MVFSQGYFIRSGNVYYHFLLQMITIYRSSSNWRDKNNNMKMMFLQQYAKCSYLYIFWFISSISTPQLYPEDSNDFHYLVIGGGGGGGSDDVGQVVLSQGRGSGGGGAGGL